VANLREEFEQRYGQLGDGARSVVIDGVTYGLGEVMRRLGFGYDGIRLIDAPPVEPGRYAIRFFDGEDRRIVCLEFAANFNFLEEHRVHIAEWLGDAYFETEWEVHCPMDF
jgi:hypothetical protein